MPHVDRIVIFASRMHCEKDNSSAATKLIAQNQGFMFEELTLTKFQGLSKHALLLRKGFSNFALVMIL